LAVACSPVDRVRSGHAAMGGGFKTLWLNASPVSGVAWPAPVT
jgi:hypothetical protein